MYTIVSAKEIAAVVYLATIEKSQSESSIAPT